ncbi:hypothetical protein EYZ11_010221 [Aspergillus tanneri]|uniref:Uncharacterized protein n=1 Tax=Aspergillus tanneri TaxID=1220188 RepID=A0A4S3J6F4_9EURO|nr:hypothetical protein EYZ11_010221 [Aspergillus tanneri]
MASKDTFYAHNTNLWDLTHPADGLPSTTMPLAFHVPQVIDLQALVDLLANPVNAKNDLSVAALSDEERESVCHRWLTMNDLLNYMKFITLDTRGG